MHEIMQVIKSRRKLTNCFSFFNEIQEWFENNKADFYLVNGDVFIFYKANGFYKFYYYVDDLNCIQKARELLQRYSISCDITLSVVTRDADFLTTSSTALLNSGFKFYAQFDRFINRGGAAR